MHTIERRLMPCCSKWISPKLLTQFHDARAQRFQRKMEKLDSAHPCLIFLSGKSEWCAGTSHSTCSGTSTRRLTFIFLFFFLSLLSTPCTGSLKWRKRMAGWQHCMGNTLSCDYRCMLMMLQSLPNKYFCQLPVRNLETPSHLFFECSYSRQLYMVLGGDLGRMSFLGSSLWDANSSFLEWYSNLAP